MMWLPQIASPAPTNIPLFSSHPAPDPCPQAFAEDGNPTALSSGIPVVSGLDQRSPELGVGGGQGLLILKWPKALQGLVFYGKGVTFLMELSWKAHAHGCQPLS